ncbi:MAG: RNA-binding S4 domain-containing protein [Trueperaceae bacterium]
MAPNDPPHDPATDADGPEVLRLDDALKLAGVAGTGGQAKQLVQQGDVRVNGEIETRRKRKLVEGDVVEVGGESFEIALSDDLSEDEEDEDREVVESGDAPSATAAFAGDADDGLDGDPDADALELTPAELERWAAWVVERMREDDGEAVILRLGSLHPDALEALFELLPADVEDAVLDALDAVLEDGEEGGFGPPGPRRDGPLEA